MTSTPSSCKERMTASAPDILSTESSSGIFIGNFTRIGTLPNQRAAGSKHRLRKGPAFSMKSVISSMLAPVPPPFVLPIPTLGLKLTLRIHLPSIRVRKFFSARFSASNLVSKLTSGLSSARHRSRCVGRRSARRTHSRGRPDQNQQLQDRARQSEPTSRVYR